VPSPAARLAEAVAAIRAHLDGPGPDAHGAAMGLRPAPGSPGPQLWVAAHGPRGFALAGRYGDGWLPYLLTLDEWRAGRDAVLSTSAEAGRDGAVTLGLQVNAVLADDHRTAHAILEHPAVRALALLFPAHWYREGGWTHPLGSSGLHALVATRMGADLRRAADAVPIELIRRHLPHGTPEEIAAHVRRHEGVRHVRLADYAVTAGATTAEASAARRHEVVRLLAGAG
jgi:phthiodiolone/phenolphthiodiolone dimycocerosates ketoreductase